VSAVARAHRILLVLWAGSLWSLALWVTPLLFHLQHDGELAGALAAHLFAIEAYLGVATALAALLLPRRARFGWGYLAAALLALMQWGMRPALAAARQHGLAWGMNFTAWHMAAAIVYGLACIGAALLVWQDNFR
jgi:hypothetical protein